MRCDHSAYSQCLPLEWGGPHAGDGLVRDLGLTSAKWQVVGNISASPTPLPIAAIARNMGLTRQGVRLTAIDLERAGLIRFIPNPNHRRAPLVELMPEGVLANQAAKARQSPWARQLGRGSTVRSVDEPQRCYRPFCYDFRNKESDRGLSSAAV